MDTAEPVVSEGPEDIAEEPVAPELEEPAELEAEEPEPTVEEPASASEAEEAPPPPPKRARVKAAPKPKAEPKRRGRPPGSRNRETQPVSVQPHQDRMEALMTTMRERRQAHQERQHSFFQSFLP